jgi:uncharacterized membrane protein YfcA
MNAKLYLTIAAIVAVLYGIGFLVFPGNLVMLYGEPPEVHVTLNIQFFGSALLAWGLIVWFARDCRDWAMVRGVLIGSVVGQVVGVLVTIWGMTQGILNAAAWSSLIVYVLLLAGALYSLFTGPHKLNA